MVNNARSIFEELQSNTRQLVTKLPMGAGKRTKPWFKTCPICGEHKPVTDDDWFLTPAGGYILYGRCRDCHVSRRRAK